MKIDWKRGFTLIELVIVIAILGIVASGIVIAVNPLGKLNSANLAKVKTFSASTENALIISQVGKWSFEETSSPSLDTSGYGRHAYWSATGVTSEIEANCELGFGRCVRLDGSNGSMSMSDNAFSNLSTGTISAWVFLTGSSNIQGIVFWAQSSIGRQLIFEIETQKVHWAIQPGFSCGYSPSWCPDGYGSTTNIPYNRWNHIAVTVDASGWKLYLNGNLDKSVPSAREANFFNDIGTLQSYRIGEGYPGSLRHFRGMIDELSIFSEALISSQIQHLYAQGTIRRAMAFR